MTSTGITLLQTPILIQEGKGTYQVTPPKVPVPLSPKGLHRITPVETVQEVF